ncbi:MAG TPA: transglycosylase SLT domain-containing protein [Burkholderiales bacterium]|nr:transglycosylase SLT domain-containing protein [Burkholderiales bacterium]
MTSFQYPLTFTAAALFLAGSSDALAPHNGPDSAASCPVPAAEAQFTGFALASEPDPQEQALVAHLSRRFYIASEAAERMVGAAFQAAREVGLDPLLLLAVIAVESRFNPVAESVMGAKGLMQIIPRYHRDKLADVGGDAAVLDPESNIHVGARILREYVQRMGSLEGGLQFYNGALRDGSASYAGRVMAERQRLDEVLRSAGRRS